MVKPIEIKDNKTNDVYVLEFNRDSVRFAESRGFDIDNLAHSPMSSISDLFFYAFRMHHPKVAKDKTDKMLFEEMGGMPKGMLERLQELYVAPFEALTVAESDEERKNSNLTVTF